MPEKQIAELKKLILQNEKALAELKKTVFELDQRRAASQEKHSKRTSKASETPNLT